MRARFSILIATALVVASAAQAADKVAPEQDAQLLQFMSRALPWCPNSTFKITEDSRKPTPSGAYRIVEVERSCQSEFLSGITTVVVDEPSSNIWFGSVSRLPANELKGDPKIIKEFIDGTLPDLVEQNLRMRIKIDWDVPSTGPSTIIPFDMVVESGYGQYRRSAGVTTDGGSLLMGAPLPFDRDPVEYRRELFAASDIVAWDHKSDKAVVQIVEFSDFECPACRLKWPLIKNALNKHGDLVDHGMVNLPLPAIHPWAFRAASAAWCIAAQDGESLVGFKELFYSMQADMELSLVTDTAVDFVIGNNLDEDQFRACYLKPSSLDVVHQQMELGDDLAIRSTPTYFANGWMIQIPDISWFNQFIETLVAGEEP